MSRINNAIKNILTSLAAELLVILLSFGTRTVFINNLGTQYLGINGLFSNILSMLALAELGVGSAITFNLYKPIANNNQHHIILLMKLYRDVYRIVGFSIAGMGILLIPFLPFIIKDNIYFVNIKLVFFIYLMQTVSSYLFFAYKSSLIKAHQKEYIITKIGLIFAIFTNILQICVLTLFKNFEIYVSLVVLTNIMQNIMVAGRADRIFPYIKEKTTAVLPASEKKEIFKNCYAAFFYKVNSRVINATDNILLAFFIGLNIVGIYSNYLLIVNTIKVILDKFYTAILASLGDLHASENVDREYLIFKVTNFFTACSFGLAAIATFVVGNEFISLWIGSNFTLSQFFVFLVAAQIYIYGLEKFLSTFRTAMGLFQQIMYRPIFGMIINLGLSLILVQYIGIYGVIIGTLLSSLLTYMWFDPYVIYRYVFKKPVFEYYSMNLKYILFVLIAGSVAYFLSQLVYGEGLIYFVIRSVICLAVTCILIVVFFYNTVELKYLLNFVKKIPSRMRSGKEKDIFVT